MRKTELSRREGYWQGQFQAMASPCELLMDCQGGSEAQRLLNLAATEAWRIEEKFSRYRKDNIVYRINQSQAQPLHLDDETAALMDFAAQCYSLSEGLFDITSGVLRQAWRFDGSDNIPSTAQVKKLLVHVGWHKLQWQRPVLCLPAGMEIDFGGIGKEYAVDRVAGILAMQSAASVLVNFGGDLMLSRPRAHGQAWVVGVDDPEHSAQAARSALRLKQGALATSGDARRFLLKDGIRYGHVLDPRSGWPIKGAPRAVTVAAPTCTEAGMLATFALLQGPQASVFLQEQGVQYWCLD